MGVKNGREDKSGNRREGWGVEGQGKGGNMGRDNTLKTC